jgi:hypothetical protein
MEAYGRAVSFKALLDRNKLNEIQFQEHEQKLRERKQDEADDEVVRQAFEEVKGDLYKLPEKVAGKVSQKRQLAIIKTVDDSRKENLALGKAGIENAKAKAELLGSIAASVTDEPSYLRGIDSAVQKQLITPEQAEQWRAKGWNEQTQAAIGQIAKQAMTAVQIHEAGIKDLESSQKTEKHQAEMPGVKAKSDEEVRGGRPFEMSTEEGTYLVSPATGTSVEAKTPSGQPIKKSKAGGEGTLAGERFDWTKSQAGKKELDDAMKEHDGLQGKEQELHRKRERLGRLMKLNAEAKGKEARSFNALDPEGKEVKEYIATPELQRVFQQQLDETTKQVADLQAAQKKIREKAKVGEFSAPQGVPLSKVSEGAPPQPVIPPAAAMPATAKPTNGQPASQPPAKPAPSAPAAPGQPKTAKKWTVKGVTYAEGQTVRGPGGKLYRVKSVVNGKIQAEPI